MKHALAALLLLTCIWACQKEIEGPAAGGGTAANVKCTGCSYLPVCDSTRLTYIDSTAAGKDTTASTLASLGDTTVNGRKFTRVSPSATFPQGLLYTCSGGDYRVFQPVPNTGLNVDSILQALGLPSGVTIPSTVETTILKSGASAGATWSDTIVQFTVVPPLVATVKLEYKLEEKGIQRTVLGKSYSNVVHVSSKLAIAIPLMPPLPIDVRVNTYYADGIGIIESTTTSNGAVQSSTKLYQYKIK